jgi:hypothetical protein
MATKRKMAFQRFLWAILRFTQKTKEEKLPEMLQLEEAEKTLN